MTIKINHYKMISLYDQISHEDISHASTVIGLILSRNHYD